MNANRSWNLAIVTTGACLAVFFASVIATTAGWHSVATGRAAAVSALAVVGCGVWLRLAAARFGPLEPEPGHGATHILHWVPPYVDGEGTWELQTCAAYDAGEPPTYGDWALESEPRDIDASDFTGWIAAITGYPVTVKQGSVRITCPRTLRFMKQEPVWWIFPAYAEGMPS